MVKIVADTLSCLSLEEARELGIPYLPQIIIFGEESYRDDTEITHKIFLEKLKSSSVLPKTAAPPPALYAPIFKEAQTIGSDIIVVCPSAELSGTYRSAQVAARDFPELNIQIIDTSTIGGALASIVLKSREWALQGLPIEKISENIKDMSRRNKTYFLVDTLEYLHKGGRIGGAQALIGSILQVKPILTIINGRVEPAESQRTHKRAVARLKEMIVSDCPKGTESHVTVMHGDAENEALMFAEELSTLLGVSNIPVYELPPAVLVHSGPGALAISYFINN